MTWIQTYTGKKFYPLKPRIEDLDIVDIAHALSMKCRFTGHCRWFYSVAEHSVRMTHIIPKDDRLWALLHDAAEAYLPDIARPIKPYIAGFKELEDQLMDLVAKRYKLGEKPKSIDWADRVMLETERRDLMTHCDSEWVRTLTGPLPEPIQPWTARLAEMNFLTRFKELTQ